VAVGLPSRLLASFLDCSELGVSGLPDGGLGRFFFGFLWGFRLGRGGRGGGSHRGSDNGLRGDSGSGGATESWEWVRCGDNLVYVVSRMPPLGVAQRRIFIADILFLGGPARGR
jgi:hypothetical protein